MNSSAERVFAYVDESGNLDLETNKDGATSYFIVLAIILNESAVESTRHLIEEIRKRYFQTGEMKSSSVKSKDGDKRRIQILNDLSKIDFKFCAVAVDKERVYKDGGLQYKQSFFKFANSLLYTQLFHSFRKVSIIADEHGDQKFIDGFKAYIDSNKTDLFWDSDVKTVSSKENVLVQLADFIVGTIARVYEKKSSPALNEEYYRLLKNNALDVQEWPTRFPAYPDLQSSEEFDSLIYMHSHTQAERFLANNANAFQEDTLLQIAVLNHLVFISKFDISQDYISTHAILKYLKERGFDGVSEQAIRSKIVAKLRDEGVLISSCTKGYKIPRSYKDLKDFVERVDGLVRPLIDRLGMARKSFLIASQGEVDLLSGANFPDLTAFVEILQNRDKK